MEHIMELSDLEICKRIAEIEGVEFVSDRGVIVLSENYNELINTICSGRYSPEQVVKITDKAAYNPLEDDALCFRLMIGHGVLRELCGDNHRFVMPKWNGTPEYFRVTDKSPNKALCLVIIKANEPITQK